MTDQTAAQTHVCYDGSTFYVVNLVLESEHEKMKLQALPGGTWDNMQDSKWCGLSLDDFVISSWEGYKKNGMKNGYTPQLNGSDSDTEILFGDGVRTPGFASLPVCQDINEVLRNVYGGEGGPCDP
jgi:hypothetical protein